jgi:uncharacterized protein YecE (DUF72 family)
MGRILVGISSWADPELVKSGFYPPEVKTPMGRLRYYAQNFPIVEMDSSYHFLPGARNLSLWLENTPQDFKFDVKAFSLLTQHPTLISALPQELREQSMAALNKEGHLYLQKLPEPVVDQVWERFKRVVAQIHMSGKLGLITFQFPPWFHPNPENYRYIEECQNRLPGYRLAMEFRNGNWLNTEHREGLLQFLKDKQLALVCVDEPQGFKTSLPPLAAVTAGFGVVRFHGRNREHWEQKDTPVNEKYNYLYNTAELTEWAAKIQAMAKTAAEIFIIFKNKHLDFPVRNAREMIALLDRPAEVRT